jgi:hypothetical protein
MNASLPIAPLRYDAQKKVSHGDARVPIYETWRSTPTENCPCGRPVSQLQVLSRDSPHGLVAFQQLFHHPDGWVCRVFAVHGQQRVVSEPPERDLPEGYESEAIAKCERCGLSWAIAGQIESDKIDAPGYAIIPHECCCGAEIRAHLPARVERLTVRRRVLP